MAAVDGRIKVPPELAGSGPFLRGRAATLAAELARLRARVVELAFTWKEGTAQQGYQAHQAKWDAAAAGLFGEGGVLGTIAITMDKVWANYVDVEQTNTSGWGH
jgi:early secretory antigenic target protein ESAT-6